MDNPIEAANRALFLQINGGADTPAWLLHAATLIADDLIYLIPVLLVWLWLQGGTVRRDLALKACAVTLLALAVNQGIGLVWTHPRPFVIGLGHAWLAHAPDSSFPSDHVTVFSAIGLTLLLGGGRRLGIIVLCAALPVAWARIFLGVHFPLDMAGAVVVAGLTHAAADPLWGKVGGPITALAERLYRLILARPIAAGWLPR